MWGTHLSIDETAAFNDEFYTVVTNMSARSKSRDLLKWITLREVKDQVKIYD